MDRSRNRRENSRGIHLTIMKLMFLSMRSVALSRGRAPAALNALESIPRRVAGRGGLEAARETVPDILRRLGGRFPGASTRQRPGAARGVGPAEAAPKDAIGDQH